MSEEYIQYVAACGCIGTRKCKYKTVKSERDRDSGRRHAASARAARLNLSITSSLAPFG